MSVILSAKQKRIVLANYQRMYITDICNQFGLDEGSIKLFLKDRGLKLPKGAYKRLFKRKGTKYDEANIGPIMRPAGNYSNHSHDYLVSMYNK